ncbi:MAG: flagellar biosynthesis protein FlhF [Firmicutes bacterium]|nr:flagellar biosynthesis protein FlhF [Bacillota bacterium]
MMVKRFTGRTAEEALARAKWELGDDAIILSSGKARERWWKFWESGFQVLVATDYVRRAPAAPTREPAPPSPEPPAAPPREQPAAAAPAAAVDHDERWGQVIHLLEGLGKRLDRMEGEQDEAVVEGREWLMQRGFNELWARKLASSAQKYREEEAPEMPIRQAIRQALVELLRPPQPIALAEPATVLFIGPTGSGKTTTIAKLAAYCHLERQKSVLLISTDTFRVAAAEQLKTYADIIGVPFRVALRPQEIPEILKERCYDVVLIDTAGHSFNHALYMAELRTIAELSGANDVELVLPATMEPELLMETALKFGDGLHPKICATKVDEVRYPGAILSAVLTLGWPLSYMTDGQNVPDDIQVAFPESLVNLLEGGTA